MTLWEFAQKRVEERLDACPVVVWFDPDGVFGELVASFSPPRTKVVVWDGSGLSTRRAAEEVYADLFPTDEAGARGDRLLLYMPQKRATTRKIQLEDPLEMFALVGKTFGDDPADSLRSLAIQATPELEPEIERLFAQGTPSLAQLDGLAGRTKHPALGVALGTESIVEAVALLMCRPGAIGDLDATVGAKAAFLDAARADLEFSPSPGVTTEAMTNQLSRYVLLSEFLLDLGGVAPASLSTIPHAPADLQARVFAICDRMRHDETLRPHYIERAVSVERELGLASELASLTQAGMRDTFPCEERFYLGRVTALAIQGQLEQASEVIKERADSVWRSDGERPLLWKLAERCVQFLQASTVVERQILAPSAKVGQWVETYAKHDGGWQLDQTQRLFEQAHAEAAQFDDLEDLIVHCRKRYRAIAGQMQERFLPAIERDGWPPDGILRQEQIFATAVKPELDAGRRVAYFFVDAMRYEMGHGLAGELRQLGEVNVRPAINVLPAVTPCGMAALLPEADNSYRLVQVADELVPSVAGKSLPTSTSRMDYMRSVFGDRFAEATLEDVLSDTTTKLKARTANRTIFVVRTQDIDGIGENMSGFQARRTMSDVLGQLRIATTRLAAAGFQTFVFAGDHGHLLLPEAEHGDKVARPGGEWLKAKRRSLVGKAQGAAAGVRLMRTEHLGIPSMPFDFATPMGFGVFTSGETYFHEGVSLQECITPLVVLHHRGAAIAQAAARVTLSYRTDRFTSFIISIKASADAMLFQDSLEVAIEAYDGSSPKAKVVGEAADCDARNPDTRLVKLPRGVEVQVPIRIQDGYGGSEVQIRATDPATSQQLGQLNLRNAVQE